MKKIISIVAIFLILFATIFTMKAFAAELTGINVTTSKDTINPGENVTVNVAFGENLGSYTVDVAYDKNLFEYISSEGGTADDNGTRIRVYFYDTTGGNSPRNSMSVTFKAKEGITTSNPTDFSITAEGLANADASVVYDDISTPIIKSVVVEPKYVDYDINLKYTGDVMKDEGKDMKIVISSTMGKNYEHTRLIAHVTPPTGGNVKLVGKDTAGLEHDIIQSGWGAAEGDPIGGQNVVKELDVKGIFDTVGQYSITLQLVDRDNSDEVIADKVFTITVKEKSTQTTPNEGNNNNQGTTDNNKEPNNNQGATNNNQGIGNSQQQPSVLPQTGGTIYAVIIAIMAVIIIAYVVMRKND